MSLKDDDLIVKYKRVGMTNPHIAAKLGLTELEVAQRYQEYLQSLVSTQSADYQELVTRFQVLCHQYQLLGESLKLLSLILSTPASPEEIRVCLTSDPSQSVQNLLSSLIVLRPTTQDEVAKLLQR